LFNRFVKQFNMQSFFKTCFIKPHVVSWLKPIFFFWLHHTSNLRESMI
jgi:hypothetical protein